MISKPSSPSPVAIRVIVDRSSPTATTIAAISSARLRGGHREGTSIGPPSAGDGLVITNGEPPQLSRRRSPPGRPRRRLRTSPGPGVRSRPSERRPRPRDRGAHRRNRRPSSESSVSISNSTKALRGSLPGISLPRGNPRCGPCRANARRPNIAAWPPATRESLSATNCSRSMVSTTMDRTACRSPAGLRSPRLSVASRLTWSCWKTPLQHKLSS